MIGDRRLGRHEKRYLRRLQTLLVVFPRDERRRMLATVRQNLEDRPRADSWNALIRGLGEPDAYARQLVHDERALPRHALWRRAITHFPSPWLAGTTLALVVVLIAGGLTYHDWYTHPVELTDSCYGLESDDVPITVGEALGHREQRVDYLDEAEVRLTTCLYSSETIEVLDVGYPDLLTHGPVELVDVTMTPLIGYGTEVPAVTPLATFTLGGHGDEREHPPRLVTYHLRFTGCARALGTGASGANLNVPFPEVTYRFRGQTHTVDLEQSSRIFLSIDREDCPDAAPLAESGVADGEDGQ